MKSFENDPKVAHICRETVVGKGDAKLICHLRLGHKEDHQACYGDGKTYSALYRWNDKDANTSFKS